MSTILNNRKVGFGNAAFEFSEDEIPEALEEFYESDDTGVGEQGDLVIRSATKAISNKPTLRDKLDRKAEQAA